MDSPKYNRTLHLPWSAGATNDDKIALSVENLIGQPIVITEKMDGSNTSLEFDGCYSRSHSGSPTHKSFDGLKALQAIVKPYIPKGFQYFGEWCFAKHSIAYDALPSYFLLFGIRDTYVEKDTKWFSWDFVEAQAKALDIIGGIKTVPVLFQGQVSSEKELKELTESLMIQPSACGGIREGVVVRVTKEFPDKDFSTNIMKCVRANHVQTSEHWKDQVIVRNKLRALDSPE